MVDGKQKELKAKLTDIGSPATPSSFPAVFLIMQTPKSR